MNLAEEAFKELFPTKEINRKLSVSYSGKFKTYNANVRYTQAKMDFSLAREWSEISEEIQKGLIQSLLLKVYKNKTPDGKQIRTLALDLYDSFIKQIPKYSKVTKIDPTIKESFDRMNKMYFNGFLDTPNLVWGRESFAKLGTYEYTSDTITISKVLVGEGMLLDFVVYHEMLHKALNYKSKNGRNYHHTPEFRRREKLFYESDAEKKLTYFLRKKRLRKAFRFF